MHSILKVQRISHGCATDTVYRLMTTEEGRIEAQITEVLASDRKTDLKLERVQITTTRKVKTVRSSSDGSVLYLVLVRNVHWENGGCSGLAVSLTVWFFFSKRSGA